MIDFVSVEIVTKNEFGMAEVTLEYKPTFWQWIFYKPGSKKTYVSSSLDSTVWYNKKNARRVGTSNEHEICNAIMWAKLNIYKVK